MDEGDAPVDTPGVGLIKLPELYVSTQDRLRSTMENSLDSGRFRLAGRLDDVLMRQGFWEDDIHLEDGALVDLEAYDAVASSIIRGFLDEINGHLDEINNSLSDTKRAMSKSPSKMDETSEIDEASGEKEEMSLLCDMNARLCDQVEIFDAIAADNAADAAGHDRKASKLGQLRRQLEEENQKLHSYPSNTVFAPIEDGESEEIWNSATQRRDTKRRVDPAKDFMEKRTRLDTQSQTLAVSSSDGKLPYSSSRPQPSRPQPSCPPPPRPPPPSRWTCGHCGEGPMSIRFDYCCSICMRRKDLFARVY